MEPAVEEKLKQEVILKGIAAAPGIAMGPAHLYNKHVPKIPERTISVMYAPSFTPKAITAARKAVSSVVRVWLLKSCGMPK